MRTGSRKGFTLIELLVVIAIIAILAAILFPVFAKAREKARQTSCLSNAKQIALSIQMYREDYDQTFPMCEIWYPTGTVATPPGGWSLGANVPAGYDVELWFQTLYPYVKNWNVFRCPSSGSTLTMEGLRYRNYTCNANVMFPNYFIADYGYTVLTDSGIASPSNLITITEGGCNFVQPWYIGWAADAYGQVYISGEGSCNHVAATAGFTTQGSLNDYMNARHNGGNNTVFADCHAKWMKVETQVLEAKKFYNAYPAAGGPTCGMWNVLGE